MLDFIWIIWLIVVAVCLWLDFIKSWRRGLWFMQGALVAAVAGAVCYFIGIGPVIGLLVQAGAFLLFSLPMFFLVSRRRKKKHLPPRYDVRRFIGATFTLEEDCTALEPCRVALEGTSDVDWAVVPYNEEALHKGDIVRIVKCEGVVLCAESVKTAEAMSKAAAKRQQRKDKKEQAKLARQEKKEQAKLAKQAKAEEPAQQPAEVVAEPAVVEEVAEPDTETLSTEATEEPASEAVATEVVAEEATEQCEEPVCEEPVCEESVCEETPAVEEAPVVYTTRYNKSFSAKLMQAQEETKQYYSELKNCILSFKLKKKTASDRLSWSRETFRIGRKPVIVMAMKGKTLCLYMALDPELFVGTKYAVENVSDHKSLAETPLMYKIKSNRRKKYAMDLIKTVLIENGLTETEIEQVDYAKDLPEKSTEELVELGLVKVAKGNNVGELFGND